MWTQFQPSAPQTYTIPTGCGPSSPPTIFVAAADSWSKVNWKKWIDLTFSENETIPYYRNSYTITSSNPNKWIATSFKFFRWLGCLIKLWESNLEVSNSRISSKMWLKMIKIWIKNSLITQNYWEMLYSLSEIDLNNIFSNVGNTM